MSDHSQRAHSLLGASSAHRWMVCPGSVAKNAAIEDETSQYAAWGTVAHEVAELCLKGNEPPEVYFDRTFTVDKYRITVDEEMVETVQVYVDYVRENSFGKELHVEEKFSLELIYEGMFGTNDAAIYDSKALTLEIIDLKGGAGKAVEVEDNPQLKYYALGAMLNYQHRGVQTVKLTIVQPRAGHRDGAIRSWETTPMELMMWADELRDLAKRTEDPDAPLVAGDHCKFCAYAGQCPAFKEDAIKSAMLDFAAHPAEMDDTQLTAILREAGKIEDWVRAVKKYAFERLVQGKTVPGYKLVAKRAKRKWAAPEFEIVSVVEEIVGPVDESQLYVRELKSPAQLEKLLPKGERERLSDFVEKKSSGVTLVHESDKRPAVDPATAEQDFDAVDEEAN